MTDREAYIALNRISGVGSITAVRLLEFFGDFDSVFKADRRELAQVPGIGTFRAAAVDEGLRNTSFVDELQTAEKYGIKVITLADAEYPDQLRSIPDPPMVLYVAGNLDVLSLAGVAIVGTRRPSIYGRDTTEKFAFGLASCGYVIFSGLAEGVDTKAHEGALKATGGKTVAVVGAALDKLYPASNKELAREIAAKGGAVISEYPFGRSADRQTFPMRNRIVSGLSKGVLVIEAPFGSGTLITVDHALAQGRSVMAVPGRIDTPQSSGSNRILRGGAVLVTSVDDVVEELGGEGLRQGFLFESSQKICHPKPLQTPLSEDEARIMTCLVPEGIHVDAVIQQTGLGAGDVNSLLVGLQLRRQIKLMPGGMVYPS